MKKSVAVAMFAALMLVPGTALAAVGDKVTGGGQTFFDSSDTKGAGSTIAFNAKQDAAGVTGQVQYINRQAGTGQDAVKFHGTVTCVFVFPDRQTAEIVATRKSARYRNQKVRIYTKDNGEGAGTNDLIDINWDPQDPNCGDSNNDDDPPAFTLARGNVQVHDSTEARSGSFSFARALRLARFGR